MVWFRVRFRIMWSEDCEVRVQHFVNGGMSYGGINRE